MRDAVSRTQMWVRARMPVCGLNETHGLVPYKGDKGDKNTARPPEGSLVETRCLIKGPKSAIVPFPGPRSGPKSRTGPGAPQKAKSRMRARQYERQLELSWGLVFMHKRDQSDDSANRSPRNRLTHMHNRIYQGGINSPLS